MCKQPTVEALPLIMKAGAQIPVKDKIQTVITRTDGTVELSIYKWADMASFLSELYESDWDNSEKAMQAFAKFINRDVAIKAFLNWTEAGKPSDVAGFAHQNISDVIDQRAAFSRSLFEQSQQAQGSPEHSNPLEGIPSSFSMQTINNHIYGPSNW
jgi:hypothetical protein